MASDAETLAAGFILPQPDDLISGGDDAIRGNARAAVEQLKLERFERINADNAATAKITAEAQARAAAIAAEQTARVDYVQTHLRTSHVDLDEDGTPYWSPGATRVQVQQDLTDGNPYYIVTA